MSLPFVHLHLHSEYSILDSIVQIDPLCEKVKKQKMPAVAITDICNLFGTVKFYKAALSQGIKPIIGSEIWIAGEDEQPFHKLILLCQNLDGYQNLSRLISKAYLLREHETPLVKREWLFEYATGLIALSGAQYGDIGQALVQEDRHKAALLLRGWTTLFPNRFYLELQRNGRQGQETYEKNLLQLATEFQCPLVATNDVVFLSEEDFEAHQARVCIQEGTMLEHSPSGGKYSEEQYFKSAEQMVKLFQDIPSALKNTVEIAKRCSLSLTLDQPVLPSFPVPEGMTESSYLEHASLEGLEKRLIIKFQEKKHTEEEKSQVRMEYSARLKTELEVISSMGFPGYFLIVADFIQWAKNNQIPVGPGRGSGAGSLVAYALAITDLDPIEYDLLFERFLNPERVSMPDFDIDFCMDNRDRVIEYVAKRYGHDNVSQIATFGTMAAKAVIRDVGRVLGHPYGFVDKIAKLIPFEIGMTLEKALEQEPALKTRFEEEEEVRNLILLALKLEGITRNVGKHAGGVVIAPSALTNFAPLYCEQGGHQAVIQFDKDDVEAIGLIKFDFLGLKTLTIIDWAVRNANVVLARKNLPPIDIQRIPLNDPQTFNLLKRCATTAVFQLESRGMKELIKRLQPDQFEEIIALVALFRPGPLQSGMVDDFINRKHGRAKVEYPHPAIEPILKPTYGVILYQEQVMQIAQVLAGYTLGGADLLRRAMGKKKPEEMAKQRAIFTSGSTERGVDERTATSIFDLMEKFAGYGFNKSHSAAYALVSYQTAWLKAHFPSPFMAAVLSADMSNTDKIVNFIEECRHCNIPVIPPDINLSDYAFTVNENEDIVYGLGAIKGVGEAVIAHIIEVRKEKPFSDFFDFCERVDSRKVNKRVFESLIKSGTFDSFNLERSVLMATYDSAMKRSEQIAKNNLFGQTDLFQVGGVIDENKSVIVAKPWTQEERLRGEKESLGMYLSGHPLDVLEQELNRLGVAKFKDLTVPKKEQKVLLAGIIIGIRSIQTKNGERMAIVMLDDRFSQFEIAIFPSIYQTSRELLVKDQLLMVDGLAGHDNFSGGLRIRAQTLYSLATAREKFAKSIQIQFHDEAPVDELIKYLKEYLILQERGACPIQIHFKSTYASVRIKLGEQWSIKPSLEVVNTLKQLESCQVEIQY